MFVEDCSQRAFGPIERRHGRTSFSVQLTVGPSPRVEAVIRMGSSCRNHPTTRLQLANVGSDPGEGCPP
jgi:hypothetical protein